MAIQVKCPCGKILQAGNDQAGRKARCPACQGLVRVPGEPEAAAGYGVEQVRKCPGCKREWPIDSVVCIDCGYHFDSGRKMRTKYRVRDRGLDIGVTWLGTYTRYRVYPDGRGRACLEVSQKLLFLPLGGETYDLSAYSALLTDYSAGDGENPDTFHLEMEGPGLEPVRIVDTADEEKFKEVIDLIAQAGGLEIKRK